MEMPNLKTIFVLMAISAVAACSPTLGSKEWCKETEKKDKAQWTAQEVDGYSKHCVMPK